MRRHHTILALLSILVVVLGVVGCSTDSDDSATDATTSEDSFEPARDEAAAGDADDGGQVGAGEPVDLDAVDLVAVVDRKIVYTGTTSAVVDDVGTAVRAARDAATVEGGYVFAQDLSAEQGRVVLKVPTVRFDAVFDAVVAIGEIEDQHIEADDVTDQFVDLESRRATLATSIDRLRGFLAQTTNVDEISRLESELTRREADHDVIAGQLRVLQDRTSFGTITAQFRVEDPELALLQEEDESTGGFGDGLAAGWDAATGIARAVATAAGFALPFAPLLAALVLLSWWWRRRSGVLSPEA